MCRYALVYDNQIFAISSDILECFFQATENMFRAGIFKSSLSGHIMYAFDGVKVNTPLSDWSVDGDFIE
jgi:hypothetical protein